jgi:hypothetical protein
MRVPVEGKYSLLNQSWLQFIGCVIDGGYDTVNARLHQVSFIINSEETNQTLKKTYGLPKGAELIRYHENKR